MNILTDEKFIFQFPTIFEHSYAQTYAKYQNENQQYFSKNNVFINNGDTFNGKYIIKYFKKNVNVDSIIDTSSVNHPDSACLKKIKNIFGTTDVEKIIDETKDESSLIQNINIISSIGLLTNKQYKEFLDQSSRTKKINYLKNNCNQLATFFKPHLMPLLQPTIKLKQSNQTDSSYKIIVTLFNKQLNRKQHHLKNCEIIEENKLSFVFKLMQCGIIVFDLTNHIASELQQARVVFNYIYNELMKYSDDEIISFKNKGIVRKFVLISTVMTFVNKTTNLQIHNENEEMHAGVTGNHILERLPITEYQVIFEFEKLILKSNHSKIKDILRTYVIGTGVIYGHEENAFYDIFINAWNNPEEMYISKLNRTVPVFHVDELAKLLFIVLKYDDCVMDSYLLAVEQETYSFNTIIKSVCNELCNSSLVLKDDGFVKSQYKFNSLTWDLICSDINIDPMLDIIVPNYHSAQTSIISNMKEITREFIEANNLHSLKVLVSGQPAHIVTNVAEYLARYYQVKLINISHIENNYLKSLKSHQNKLKIKMNDVYKKRKNTIHTMAKLAGQTINEVIDVNNQNLDMLHVSYLLEDDDFTETEQSENTLNLAHDMYFKESTNKLYKKHKKSLQEMDEDIKNIKNKIKILNFKYEDYENNIHKNKGQLDKHCLLPIIKESLSSFTCRNQGYIFAIFPLSVEQMEFIFNKDVGFPKFIILLSNSLNIPEFAVKSFCSTITNQSNKYTSNYNSEQNYKIGSNNFKLHTRHEHRVDFINALSEIKLKNIQHDTSKNKTEQVNIVNNKHNYDGPKIKCMIDYCTSKSISLLSFNIPFEIVDKTESNNLQCEIFFDTILRQIGHLHFKHDTYKTNFKQRVSVNKLKETEIINKKLKTVLYKLSVMEKQWTIDVIKTLELEKKQEHKKSIKIHNFLSTNILPKLLEEIYPVDNEGIFQYPEKTFRKKREL